MVGEPVLALPVIVHIYRLLIRTDILVLQKPEKYTSCKQPIIIEGTC